MLLTTIYVRTPLEFSIFPSLLLATTLGRLVLNVATTRLILTHAESQGMMAAGGVVQSFGEFVAGDKIVVGLIIFVIIVVIQFVVITKGATRISEVAARFALDGMPGRQMAIDADLNAGMIDEREAQRRRTEVTQQADFFGAMDGASKFVRGDAIAGIIITLINIVGGLVIGVVDAGMEVGEAAALFTRSDDRRRPGQPGAGLPDIVGCRLAGHAVERRQRICRRSSSRSFFRVRKALAVTGGFRGDAGLHELADDAAGRHRRRLHRPGDDAHPYASATRTWPRKPRRGPRSEKAARNGSRTTWPSIRWKSRSASV